MNCIWEEKKLFTPMSLWINFRIYVFLWVWSKTFFRREIFANPATHIDHPRILTKHWISPAMEQQRSFSLTHSLRLSSIHALPFFLWSKWGDKTKPRQGKNSRLISFLYFSPLLLECSLLCLHSFRYTFLARSIR
jgi:hypothetical protein